MQKGLKMQAAMLDTADNKIDIVTEKVELSNRRLQNILEKVFLLVRNFLDADSMLLSLVGAHVGSLALYSSWLLWLSSVLFSRSYN